jgi:hypothetical protein
MEFLIQPLDVTLSQQPGECDNTNCPTNQHQCGCNTVQGCACPKT